MIELTVGTRNSNKLAELQQACPDIKLVPLPDAAPEVTEGTTSLEENARLKAESAAKFLQRPAVADDTGFFVDALDGAPGVLAARFGGHRNSEHARRELVLQRLRELGPEIDRSARYQTVLCLALPTGECLFSEGVVEGAVAPEQRGEGGFGYDAVFIPADGDGRTFAEMSREEKGRMSHRARAMRAMMKGHGSRLSEFSR